MTAAGPPIVRFRGVGKRFPGVRALAGVSFDVAAGACHALCGENGAGKSTLGKLLAGIDTPDEGQIVIDGHPVRFSGPRAALAAGIAIVHQELAFCENLTVAENLCLGALPRRGMFLSRLDMHARARAQLDAIESGVDTNRLVGDLTVAEQQMVQIAAAVGSGARIIVFDEPTSSLSQHEAEHLYALIGRLRAREVTCVYVSHRMPEIFRLCDAVTVLRDGQHVATRPAAGLDEGALVDLMIGRPLDLYLPPAGEPRGGEPLLRVAGLSSPGRFHDVSFELRPGEVLGLAGLVGAGRSDVAQALFGLDSAATGRIEVGGVPLTRRSPESAMRAGLGFLPEDRKRQGLVLDLPALANVTLPILPTLARLGWIRAGSERAVAREVFDRMKLRPPDLDAVTASLSGGNQQKVALAKWLAARCRVLILDEPTRGVDVSAKAEIHALVHTLARAGAAIVLISSELPELLALATRTLVLRQGRVVGETGSRPDQGTILRLMAGLGDRADPS